MADNNQPRPVVHVRRMTPNLQVFIMMCTNLLVLAVVWATLWFGYPDTPHHRTPPGKFFVIECFIIVLNWIGLYPRALSIYRLRAIMATESETWKPGPLIQWWEKRRASQEPNMFPDLVRRERFMDNLASLVSFRGITYLSALLPFYGMWDLVERTGGGIESPYAQLLVGSAILGPLVVMSLNSLPVLGLIAIGVVVASDRHASKPGCVLVKSGSKTECRTTGIYPHWGVYASVTLFLVLSVLLITLAMLREITPPGTEPPPATETPSPGGGR